MKKKTLNVKALILFICNRLLLSMAIQHNNFGHENSNHWSVININIIYPEPYFNCVLLNCPISGHIKFHVSY